MAVDTLENNLRAVDVDAVRLAVFDGAEAEFLALAVQNMTVAADEFERSGIAVGGLGGPQPWIADNEIDMGDIAVAAVGDTRAYRSSGKILDRGAHFGPFDGTVEEAVGTETAVHTCVDGHPTDVQHGLGDDKYGPDDTAEVPIVGTTLSHIDLSVGTFLAHFHFEEILLFTEIDAVADIESETIETSLMSAGAGLTTVDGHLGVGHDGFEDNLRLPVAPRFGQRELVFVQSFLVGDTRRILDTVEPHAILVGAEALKFPARRYADGSPTARILSVGTVELPPNHVVTAVAGEIKTVCGNIVLTRQRQDCKTYEQ